MNNLRQYRQKSGMTLQSLATALGVTRAYVSLVDLNRRQMSPEWASVLCPMLGVTRAELMGTDILRVDDVTAEELEELKKQL